MSIGTLVLFVVISFALSMVPTVWAITDVVNRNFDDLTRKRIWIVLVVFVPCLGGVAYLIFGRRQGRRIEPR
jgi:hypothetical protein